MNVFRHRHGCCVRPMMAADCASEPDDCPLTGDDPAAAGARCSACDPDPAGPRVFFVEPKDGATVKSPVQLKFGIENFEIAAVPAGDGRRRSGPVWGTTMSASTPTACPPGTDIVKGAAVGALRQGRRPRWTCS